MCKSYLTQFLRNIKRDKTFFSINLIGLTTGLVCVFLIYFWVNDELRVDKFHEKDSQLYSVFRNRIRPNGIVETSQSAPGPLAESLKDELPEVEYAVGVNYMTISSDGNSGIIADGDNEISVKGQFAGKDYFNVFTYPLIQGDKNTVFANKEEIVITEGLAKKLYNTTEDIIGKTVKFKYGELEDTFQVSGICQNPPYNSTIQFDLIFSYEWYLKLIPKAKNWPGSFANTYLILKKGTNVKAFNKKIKNFIELKHLKNKNRTLFIQQYSKKYLYGKFENGLQVGGRIFYVKLFSMIAFFILIIACANFINLSTAKASGRMKEIGIKKAIGADRKTLIIQFFGESLTMTLISSFGAICIAGLLLPFFNELTGKDLSFDLGIDNILFISGIILFTGLVSGSYPALYLSSFNPVTILKDIKINTSFSDKMVRKGLVVFQFIISVTLIIVFLVISKQIKLIQTKDLGYKSNNIIFFQRKGPSANFKVFLTELKNLVGVKNASSMNNNILNNKNTSRMDSWEGKISDNTVIIPFPSYNYDFIETMGIKMKAGRSFSQKFPNENKQVIINESAVKMMGFKEPIGKIINIDRKNREIIGVVKNFHFESLYKEIEPLAIKFNQYGRYIYVKLITGEEKITIKRIKKLYKKFYKYPFEFSFLDDAYQAIYKSEIRLALLIKSTSAIAIIISLLGLLGLAVFSSQKRFKEICIRKVHGSTSFSIMLLLSINFTKLVTISIIIALPVSYFIMNNWLNQFANKITPGWWIFIVPCLITYLITWITVGIQTLKVATVKPAIGLKHE